MNSKDKEAKLKAIEKEIWKPLKVKGFENYSVSSWGNVRNDNTGYIRSLNSDNGRGYINLTLKANGEQTKIYVHREVARSFFDDFEEEKQVNHIDKNKKNNFLTNLEMVTDSENKKYSQEEYIDGHLNSQGKMIYVFDINGNFLFERFGIYKTCRELNINPFDLWKVATKQIKSYKGYVFRYTKEF